MGREYRGVITGVLPLSLSPSLPHSSLHQETSSAPPSLSGWLGRYKFKLADLVQKLHCACIMKIGNVSMSALSAPYRKNLADLGSSSSIGVFDRNSSKAPWHLYTQSTPSF